MLDRITPVILTQNEAPNIARALARLGWARDIVVVDGGSDDATPAIARSHDNVRFFERPFDDHARQWTYAIEETGIETEWVLRLDADYMVEPELVAEMAALAPPAGVMGYRVPFAYCIHGRRLRASLYPPMVRLFRRGAANIVRDGHTERVTVSGPAPLLKGRILHDDRKSVARFLDGQRRYMAMEAEKLTAAGAGTLDLADRIRRRGRLAPVLVFLQCLFAKGLILDGRAGLFYAYQRTLSEIALALYLMERDLTPAPGSEQGAP